jgi:uncharacterized protein (DUF433 family)
MESELDRITINPKMKLGQPCIRGMRMTVKRVLELIETYPNQAGIYLNYPELEPEDLEQALIFADRYPEILEFHRAEDIRIIKLVDPDYYE